MLIISYNLMYLNSLDNETSLVMVVSITALLSLKQEKVTEIGYIQWTIALHHAGCEPFEYIYGLILTRVFTCKAVD